MITGVQDVYLMVQDMDQAVDFYVGTLGLSLTEADPHFSALDAGGVRIGLHWTGGTPVPVVPRNAHGALAGATLTLRVDDAAAHREQLERQGVEVLGFSQQPWGTLVTFVDPDGNVLKLMQPPD